MRPDLPSVVIFRDRLLPPSETFIRNQGEAMREHTPWYAGSRVVHSGLLSPDRVVALQRGNPVGYLQEYLFKRVQFAPAFIGRLRRLRPVLIHAHFGPDGALALPIARALGIPLLVTFHGYDALVTDEAARRSFYTHRMYLRRREQLKETASLFIAVSQFIAKRLRRLRYDSARTTVHYIGVDPDTFVPDPGIRREPLVLFVGRLVEKKGCIYLLRAMELVQAKRDQVRLVVIGDGPLRESLEDQAAGGLRQAEFLGSRPSEEVRSWMSRASVLCVPSVVARNGDAEGFGMVFIEAQAMELPVVSFATGGVPEAVLDGETGFLLPEGDWRGLADRILTLLDDRDLAQRLGRQGRTRVREQFDLHKQTALLEQIYRQVVGQSQ
jgi:glycosyltransferase involved in cell wall biosynthesis